MMWLEIDMDTSGNDVRVTARGSRGERPHSHTVVLDQGIDALTTFTNKVGRAVRTQRELDPPVIEQAQAIHSELFKSELRDTLMRMLASSLPKSDDARDKQLLVRLFVRDRALLAVPWEALCEPGSTEGFWGTDPRMLIARGVSSSEPWVPREVLGAVRVLAIAPGDEQPALTGLREVLNPFIEAGEVEWLEPIAGPKISAEKLFDRLRRSEIPHIVHWLGHGGEDMRGRPLLRLADDDEGEQVWITAEALARELSAYFVEDLRLVILETCAGAKAGAFGSAAEQLLKAGADAVVAHLWPVRADVARVCSNNIYRSLTAATANGDIGTSVSAARRTLLAQSAEAFSPILFLRGPDSVLFDFSKRKPPEKQREKRRTRALAPALQALLEHPRFTVVAGDIEEDRAALRTELLAFLEENGDKPDPTLPFSAISQRCVLRFGEEVLQALFQHALPDASPSKRPPIIDAIGALVPPGVHVTLLWRPYLEHAIAEKQPHKTIYAIQVSLAGSNAKPRIIKRAAGTNVWKMDRLAQNMDPTKPIRFDIEEDIVVLRMYGGYSPEARPIFSPPVLTEDDHINGLMGDRPPQWLEELLAWPRIRPGLFLGLSVLDWHHRLLLRWLYDQRQAPKDSLAILTPNADRTEPGIWDTGGGLPGKARVAAIMEEPAELAQELEAFAKEANS